jgi:HSP20 family protein
MGYLVKTRGTEGLLNLWDDFFELGDFFEKPQFSKSLSAAIDIESDENNVYVTTELPGIEKDKIEIEYEKGILSIKGEKSEATQRDEKNRAYREISRGNVERRVQVSDVDFENAKADYKNGHLELTLPKLEKSKLKKLNIN